MVDYSCVLIQAGPWDDEDYQEYYYEHSGERVPEGEDIGVELTIGGHYPVLYLLDGIKFPS